MRLETNTPGAQCSAVVIRYREHIVTGPEKVGEERDLRIYSGCSRQHGEEGRGEYKRNMISSLFLVRTCTAAFGICCRDLLGQSDNQEPQ